MTAQDDANKATAELREEAKLHQELQQHPQMLMRLAENALLVAESLRDNYFANTARFVAHMRAELQDATAEPLMSMRDVDDLGWAEVQGEVVTFIDGGVGRAPIAAQAPLLLRVGSYRVRVGERNLTQREEFTYYPVIFGDLEGGSKERKDFPDIVRITAELLGGLAALERTPDLEVLLFHGPLVYLMASYAGHTPFTERDIDLFLRQYTPDSAFGSSLKEEFLREAQLDIYPRMTNASDEWVSRRLFEPLAWMAFLYRRLICLAQQRDNLPLIAGVVERGELRNFSERILLERVFRRLRTTGRANYFNEIYGRSDLTSAKNFLDRLGYDDTLLLAMLLRPGQMSEPWEITKYDNLRHGDVTLPGEPTSERVDFSALKPGPYGFPRVRAFYVAVSETTEPVRVEMFDELGEKQLYEMASRVYLYSRLLPGYGFPVGLDIADKYAKVPAWLTDAYSKLIRFHLGVSLQRGEISDEQMRRILVQAIYMTQRDWLFRPGSR